MDWHRGTPHLVTQNKTKTPSTTNTQQTSLASRDTTSGDTRNRLVYLPGACWCLLAKHFHVEHQERLTSGTDVTLVQLEHGNIMNFQSRTGLEFAISNLILLAVDGPGPTLTGGVVFAPFAACFLCPMRPHDVKKTKA